MKKKYNSVLEMTRDLSEDKTFVESLEKQIASRELVKKLFVLRNSKGISQKEMAARMNCTQSRISKLESSDDADLSLGDLQKYLAALGMEFTLSIGSRSGDAVAKVKHHAFAIQRITDQLAEMAASDKTIAKGVGQFFGEAAFNLIRMLHDSAKKLPIEEADSPSRFEIEILDETSGREEPERKSKGKRKPVRV